MSQLLFDAVSNITLRADKSDRKMLCDTFVNVGQLMTILMSNNSHVLFGRRGTGKTHVLEYLRSKCDEKGDCPIYVDLRTIGSSCSVYFDTNIPLTQRVVRLVIDVFQEINDQILTFIAADDARKESYLHEVTPLVEKIRKAICSRQLHDPRIVETSDTIQNDSESAQGFGVGLDSASLEINGKESKKTKYERKETIQGCDMYYVHFPAVSSLYKEIMDKLENVHIIVMLDEFSEIPLELQPYLADMLRRSLVAVRGITLKFGAIEHRTCLKKVKNEREYVGLEIGADCFSCNLDEYMVFNNNQDQSLDFFRSLLYKHVNNELSDSEKIDNPEKLVRLLFSGEDAFREWVRAAEGVPRDAFNILNKAVAIDYKSNKVTLPSIRKGAKVWYNADKETSLSAYPHAIELMHWIVDKVIGKRHARAFLLENSIKNELIDNLYDSRVLHIIKTNVSGREEPGRRYNAYAIDYGCYCNLINTQKAPTNLFQSDQNGSANTNTHDMLWEVPQDDYRSIRRAVLNLEAFEEHKKTAIRENL